MLENKAFQTRAEATAHQPQPYSCVQPVSANRQVAAARRSLGTAAARSRWQLGIEAALKGDAAHTKHNVDDLHDDRRRRGVLVYLERPKVRESVIAVKILPHIKTKIWSAGLAGLLFAVLPTMPALAMNSVPCDRDDYLWVELHYNEHGAPGWLCFANAGQWSSGDDDFAHKVWVTRIWTGNNRVRWFGDGRWQPDGWIEKWTDFSWPNHPGGVRVQYINIE